MLSIITVLLLTVKKEDHIARDLKKIIHLRNDYVSNVYYLAMLMPFAKIKFRFNV